METIFPISLRQRLSLRRQGRNGSPSGSFARWFFLLTLLVTAVTGVKASDHNPWQDYDIHCPFWAEHYGLDPILFNYDETSNRYYIEWRIVLLDDHGDDELFREDKGHGLTTYIKVGNQEEVYLGNFHSGHKSNSMVDPQLAYYQNNMKLAYWMKSNGEFTHTYFPLGGKWQIVKEWSDESPTAQQIGEYKKGITVRWYIPDNLLNTTITIRAEGGWYKYDSDSHYNVNVSKSVTTSYAFSLPAMSWNTNYSVAPDGTITVPYSFDETTDTHNKANHTASAPTNIFDLSYLTSAGGSAPTKGHSHIATRINGVWNENISNHNLDGYVPSNYTFNLSDIDMDMRSSFTIQPYVEFTHENDKDANNGTKVYQNFAENMAFKPLGIAENLRAVFDQDTKTVTLTWTGKDVSNYTGAHWAVYRGYDRINWLDTNVTTCTDTHFNNEEDVEYCVYYVLPSWNQETKVDNLKATTTVNTSRTVPVNNLQAVSSENKVTLTWTSRAFPTGMNNKFDIYLNDEKVQTITPAEGQTTFKWEHRDVNGASGRTNYTQAQTQEQIANNEVEAGLDAYSTEDLDACTMYTYRVVGQIDGKELNSATQADKAIGAGTTYENFVCSKGDNQGSVLLTWNVRRLANQTQAETYIIERRVMTQDASEDSWQKLTTLDSDKTFMTWEDKTPLPGVFYEYRITCYNWCENGNRPATTAYDTGFAMSSGVISGRITYGTGTAVGDVKVTLRQNNEDGEAVNHLRSLQFSGPGTGMLCTTSANDIKKLLGKDFSIQAYVNPNSSQMNGNGTAYVLYDISELFSILLKYNETAQTYQLGTSISGVNSFSDVTIPANQWSHVSCVYSKQAQTTTFYVTTDADHIATGSITGQTVATATSETGLALGNSVTLDNANNFGGYLDEFRFFKRALTQNDIKKNFNHPMGGTETDLAIYYPMDENMGNQNFVYDFSKSNNASNGHHATAHVPALSSTYTPSEEQLSLMGMTDTQGNYVIRGVPFSGEGTNYTIIPTMGIHEFSPAYQSRYVSASSLVHNSVDFEDISSFPVSGSVRYANTDYPVEGCNIYVDGQISAKNGEPVTTNAYGEFTVSVPIGDHFIEIRKSGHTFAAAGRYPADPNNTDLMHTFDQKITGLEFIDETLCNFTGRVVGGSVEGEKTVGFGLSKNNIGVVELVLSPMNELYRLNVVKNVSETTSSLDTNTENLPVASATTNINSSSWRGANADYCKKVFIHTDPSTGEFSAMLPPLQYKVESMTVVKTGQDLDVSTTIDITSPLRVMKDSVCDDNGDVLGYYEYVAMLNHTYHSTPSFTVEQKGSSDGHFGIGSTTITDEQGTIVIDDIFSKNNETGAITYKYGAPLFVKGDRYRFNLKGFEEYTNADGAAAVTTRVPLSEVVVTINNALSASQGVYLEGGTTEDGKEVEAGDLAGLESNQIALNEEGEATYEWSAGYPNIAGDFTRTISISYDIDGRIYQWSGSGMKAIVLGELPTGNNFVTSGPDHLDMILRDPPGSASFAEWSSGTVTTHSSMSGSTIHTTNSIEVTNKFGFQNNYIQGTPVVGKIEVQSTVDDLTIGVHQEYETESATSKSTTTAITTTIATKGEPEYVGDQGDVFIGTATNIIFGKARNLGFVRDGEGVKLALDDAVTTGVSFGTYFSYTLKYIEETLLPNLEAVRNRLLVHVMDDAAIASYTNSTNKSVYLTTLTPDDEDFGQPGSYTQVIPQGQEGFFEDSVQWVNNQIDTWIKNLKFNEEEKVQAYVHRTKDTKNYSFDSGNDINFSIETESSQSRSREWTIQVGGFMHNNKGFDWNKFGIDVDIEDETMTGDHNSWEHEYGQNSSFSYTLSETGDADALTVDVYEYGAFSPIFRTRGGQTSAPYEGEVRTKYFQPGTIIMEGTMQIEVPQIDVEVPVVSDIPSGSAANYVLKLSNASEIGADVAYRLGILDETNPNGATLTMDGKEIPGLDQGRLIKVPGNQTLTKALQLRQTDLGVLDYENIGVVFASDNEPDDIADTIYITAHFTPSSSAVDLALSNNIMNTQTGTNLKLTFNNFDRNYKNLKAFRVQYKKQGSTDWTLLREYVLKGENKTQSNEMLPEGASIDYTLDMNQFTDGDYLFRVLSVATYGTDEVYRSSEEMALVKDMQRPRPLGQPEPADGILSAGDELSVTFNETILKGELTQAANLKVTGVLNGAEVAHETALSMQNTEATAQTEADILLGGKDFSIDTWVNLNGGTGTLLSHGKGNAKMTVGTDANNHLVVKIGSETYTSENTVPTGAWVFLTLSYSDGKLNATVAKDATETNLFNAMEVVAYEGNGPLTVGKQASGAMHELLLWDEAHDMTEALLQRSRTKNPATRHLIGYWKMDEGEGKTIRDYSRNRHMTMSAETWYMNNENKAVSLTDGNYLSIDASDLPSFNEDDYAVEFWVRGDAQLGDAQLLQMGEVGLWVNAEGELQFTGKGAYNPVAYQTNIATSSGNIMDNAWHHVALNVLRQGAAAVYVDGVRRLSTNAANVGGIATNNLLMGVHRRMAMTDDEGVYAYDRPFTGQVDEVRVWNATLNADKLLSNRKMRLTGSEDGLSAYYPFETKQLDQNNQVVTTASAEDLARTGHEAQINSQSSILDSQFTNEAPALRQKKTEVNVPFTFVASNEKVVITIDEEPAMIEGCTLNFTVRDVRDENGNYSLPAVWSAFVNQNQLVWAENSLALEQQQNTTGTVSATVVNKGGQQQMWTLTGMPAWLVPSTESGETNPLSQTEIDFTVMPSAPLGRNEVTVYLTGNDNIDVPLTLNIKVNGEKPDWTVNPNDFDGSMNVIAQLFVENVESNDPDDIVAAFIGEECRGVANLEYSPRYDGFFVTMDIYANSSELSNETPTPVTFRAYDASTGTLYPVVNSDKTINYAPMALEGTYAAPVKLTTANYIEQKIELRKGWNWISLYVITDDMSPNGIFANVAGSLEEVKTQIATAGPQGVNGIGGNLTTMSSGEMYAVKMSDDCTLRLVGSRANVQVSLAEGWNWIGYGQQLASVDNALSGMSPVNGDLLKGQQGVTYFDTYAWAGSLLTMQPGKGYQLKSSKAITFTYSNDVTGAESRTAMLDDQQSTDAEQLFTPIDYHRYADNMTMTAQVKMDGRMLTDAEIGVFTNDGECRTTATISENGRAYIVIPGDEGCQLMFQVAVGGKIFHAAQTVNYEVDAVYGSYSQPFVIDLNDVTGISEVENRQNIEKSVYDLQGRKVSKSKLSNSKLHKGIYIVNGQKKVK